MGADGNESMQEMHFFYDAQSRLAFVECNGTKYHYLHNLQGDIIGIVDKGGTLGVEYKYDAWGKTISTINSKTNMLVQENPFGYRRYERDIETGLHFLLSRYYCARVGRFISADIMVSPNINDNSIFAYCSNNSVNNADPCGLIYYKVTLNIYDEKYSSDNTYGHYDITLIKYNDNAHESARKTISYGPSEKNGSSAIITIYNGNNPRSQEHLYECLVIYDDISDDEMKVFYNLFWNYFVGEQVEDTDNQYYVKNKDYTLYSFDPNRTRPGLPDQNYCGSAALYLLNKVRNIVSGTSIILNEVLLVMRSMPVFFSRKNTYPLGELRGWFSTRR